MITTLVTIYQPSLIFLVFMCLLFFRLSKLDLSDNKLSWLTSRTFSDSRRLNSLDLSGNNLTNLVGDCTLCNTSLHYLSLERNKISQLSHRMFDWVSDRVQFRA